jgi:hypothetical protein
VIRRVPADPDDARCPYAAGQAYRRKVRGLEGRPTIRVLTEPARQRLGDVSQREAVLEGFAGRRALEAFRLDWVRRYDRWSRLHPTASDEEVLARWRARHARRHCWVLVFALVDAPRLLAPQRDILAEVARRGARASSGRALDDRVEYTTGATIDHEAEAVDEATLTRIVAGELGARAEASTSRSERRRTRRRRLFGDGA